MDKKAARKNKINIKKKKSYFTYQSNQALSYIYKHWTFPTFG